MKPILRLLGAAHVTMAGFGLLAAGVVAAYNLPAPLLGLITAPLALLALNLAAAILLRPALRRGGLGVFHVSLLAMLLLAGWGRLTHFDARIEIAEGDTFHPSMVEVTAQGPLHGKSWQDLAFRQGGWLVNYAPRVRRADTLSQVWLPGESAPRVVGDDTPLVLDGYRFYSTHNKGFAPVLTWRPDAGEAVQGAMHMPSYPLFDWKQENTWTSPDGRTLKFWLRVDQPLPEHEAWTLSPRIVPVVLVMEVDGARHELVPGAQVRLDGATLSFDRLTGWMGYRIFYDPTLLPLLAASLLAVAGMAWHLWGRTGTRLAVPAAELPAT